MRTAISSSESPLNWTGAGLMVVSGAAAAGLGELYDHRTMPVTAIIGLVLGLVVASAPMFMAIRLILLNGVLLVAASALGVGVADNALAAGLVMAVLAFIGAVWTAVPVVGAVFSGLPVLVFLLLVAKAQEFTSGAATLIVAIAAAIGLVAPIALAVLLSIADPRKIDRKLVASAWTPGLPAAQRTLSLQVLLLDGAPAPLIYITTQGVLGLVCREWLLRRGLIAADDSEESTPASEPASEAASGPGIAKAADAPAQVPSAQGQAAAKAAEANGAAVRTALAPRGKAVPRPVTLDTAPLAEAAEAAQKAGNAAARGTWQLWASSQEGAAAALNGKFVPRLLIRPAVTIVLALIRSVLRPDVSAFRYGVQRALALGVAIFALVMSHGNENVFWVTLTLVSVLQTNMPQTLVKTVQRVAGTLVGVVLAIALSLVLPTAVLVPWLAGAAILVGLAFQRRNYAVMSGLIAFAIVLLFGAPTNKVLEFAGMRAMDVAIGGVLAAVVARIVLPVHANPAVRREQAIEALRSLQAAIQQRLADPAGISIEKVLGRQANSSTALANLDATVEELSDRRVAAAYQKDTAQLRICNEELFVVGAVVVRLVSNPAPEDLTMDDAMKAIGEQIDQLAAKSPAPAA